MRRLVEHEAHVRAFILALVPDWIQADEIFQDTCVRLYEKIGEWEPARDFGAWARTVAYYEVLSHRKVAKRERKRFGQPFIEAVVRHYDERPNEDNRRGDAMKICLEKLNASNRRLLDLRYRDSLSVDQVAHLSRRTVAATQKALTRIRKQLRDCVSRTLWSLEWE